MVPAVSGEPPMGHEGTFLKKSSVLRKIKWGSGLWICRGRAEALAREVLCIHLSLEVTSDWVCLTQPRQRSNPEPVKADPTDCHPIRPTSRFTSLEAATHQLRQVLRLPFRLSKVQGSLQTWNWEERPPNLRNGSSDVDRPSRFAFLSENALPSFGSARYTPAVSLPVSLGDRSI